MDTPTTRILGRSLASTEELAQAIDARARTNFDNPRENSFQNEDFRKRFSAPRIRKILLPRSLFIDA